MTVGSDNSELIRESVQRYLTENYSFRSGMDAEPSTAGFNADQWTAFAELGLFSLLLPEDRGGMGGTTVDVAIVVEEFGRSLVTEPYASLAVPAFALMTSEVAKIPDTLFDGLMDGSARIALAHLEGPGPSCEIRQNSDKWTLNGSKHLVLGAPLASHAVVSADLNGDSDAPTLVLVDLAETGVDLDAYVTLDGTSAATIRFSDAACVEPVAAVGEASQNALVHCLDVSAIASCAEAIGCMDALLEKTVAYSRTRKQFNVTLSSFQVLQHRMVDMKMATELCRSITYRAALALDRRHPMRRATVSAAKVFVGRESRTVAKDAIQIHGGMGITDELDISHYAKRLLTLSMSYGDSDEHLDRFDDLVYPSGPDQP